MKKRIAIVVLVVVVLGVGALILVSTDEPKADLVYAWQLVPEGRYRGLAVTDPFVSWSPDSQSLLFGAQSVQTNQDGVFEWKVGGNDLRFVVRGTSPNHLDGDAFLYLRTEPKSIMRRSLSTGAESEVAQSAKKSDFWGEVAGFAYDPARKAVILRLTRWTPHYFPGTEQFDLSGKQLGDYVPDRCEGVVECSRSPKRDRWAIIVQPLANKPARLDIAPAGKGEGREVATGMITAVGWSPARDVVTYGEGTTVTAVRPSDGLSVVVARFQPPKDPQETRFICRMSWSPDGKYLAAMVYVSALTGDFPVIYVLDMSRFKWD